MQQVKAGVDVDDMGEPLNNVEKVLKKYGIALRDTTGDFRDIGEVIDEVGNKWKDFDGVQQRQIATAMAGKVFARTYSNIWVYIPEFPYIGKNLTIQR